MPRIDSDAGLDRLWQDWQAARDARPGAPGLEVLRDLLAARGTRLTRDELHAAFARGHGRPVLSRARLGDALVPLLGGRGLRLDHAFDYLAPGADHVPVDRLRAVLAPFSDDGAALDAMLGELDADGDRQVTRADFDAYHPHGHAPGTYRASHVDPSRHGIAPPVASAPAAPPTEGHAPGGIAPLQMQIGFFRLLQGAAYRSFRRNWAANSETHLRAHDLPYTVADFTRFVRATVELYLSLGLVTGDRAQAAFRDLVTLVEGEEAALGARIAGWDRLTLTPEMAAAAAEAATEGAVLADHRAAFARTVELLLALRQAGIAPEAARPEALDRHEMTRLRHLDLQSEHGEVPATPPAADGFHGRWANVIPSEDDPRPPGAMMPVAFWYDRFQPQLLLCASILSDADLDAEEGLDDEALDGWHAEQAAAGAFRPYAEDLAAGFAACRTPVKRTLRRAWRLTAPYLNGIEKQRERAEFGRGSGALSQYVAFVDLHLGRTDVAQAEMRLSFPYFIGPATWCFLHATAERIESMEPARRTDASAAFARFFAALATMYPCPYCRYHLNRYVAPNRERRFYPVEFLILGQRPDRAPLDISLADRLATLTRGTPGAVRLFVWKLHNAVSSSIARTEPWYHRDDHPLYTSRFWPGLAAEIARLRALAQGSIPLDRAEALEVVTRNAARLAILREGVQAALDEGDPARLDSLLAEADAAVAAADQAITDSGLLQNAYRYCPEATIPVPVLDASHESYARSSRFVER
jgi:hypothetical protein